MSRYHRESIRRRLGAYSDFIAGYAAETAATVAHTPAATAAAPVAPEPTRARRPTLGKGLSNLAKLLSQNSWMDPALDLGAKLAEMKSLPDPADNTSAKASPSASNRDHDHDHIVHSKRCGHLPCRRGDLCTIALPNEDNCTHRRCRRRRANRAKAPRPAPAKWLQALSREQVGEVMAQHAFNDDDDEVRAVLKALEKNLAEQKARKRAKSQAGVERRLLFIAGILPEKKEEEEQDGHQSSGNGGPLGDFEAIVKMMADSRTKVQGMIARREIYPEQETRVLAEEFARAIQETRKAHDRAAHHGSTVTSQPAHQPMPLRFPRRRMSRLAQPAWNAEEEEEREEDDE